MTWTYDLSSQLLSEHRDGVHGYRLTYTYDPTGNRLTQDDGTFITTSVYDAANRIETADDGVNITTYTFDHNGNQRTVETADGITTYSWSYENQQTVIELPDDTVLTYTYAPVNRNSVELRVQSETETETTHALWDDQNLILEVDDTSTVEAAYTLAPKPFGNLISQHRESESSFYHFDALGSTRTLTDPSETSTDSYFYQAFGPPHSSTGTTKNPFQWIGQQGYYYNEESQLYTLRQRQYQPGQGQFLSQDPIGFAGGDGNLFRYVENNAINATDPLGLSAYTIKKCNCSLVGPYQGNQTWSFITASIDDCQTQCCESLKPKNAILAARGGHLMFSCEGVKDWNAEDSLEMTGCRQLFRALIHACDSCDTMEVSACEEEASRIARAICEVLVFNSISQSPFSQKYKGYFCYDWAYGFKEAFDSEASGKYFTVSINKSYWYLVDTKDDRVHAWITITPTCGGDQFHFDDSFASDPKSFFHTSPPVPSGWPAATSGFPISSKFCNVPRLKCRDSPNVKTGPFDDFHMIGGP